MSMCVLGMAEELKSDNIAVNALWPKTGMYVLHLSVFVMLAISYDSGKMTFCCFSCIDCMMYFVET